MTYCWEYTIGTYSQLALMVVKWHLTEIILVVFLSNYLLGKYNDKSLGKFK